MVKAFFEVSRWVVTGAAAAALVGCSAESSDDARAPSEVVTDYEDGTRATGRVVEGGVVSELVDRTGRPLATLEWNGVTRQAKVSLLEKGVTTGIAGDLGDLQPSNANQLARAAWKAKPGTTPAPTGGLKPLEGGPEVDYWAPWCYSCSWETYCFFDSCWQGLVCYAQPWC